MENRVFSPSQAPQADNRLLPVMWGIITGVIGCLFITFNFLVLIKHYMLFMAFNIIGFMLTVVLYWLAGTRQRKALGGYIDIKTAFRAIFIVILISSIMTTAYGLMYTIYIDPDAIANTKEATLQFMEGRNVPQEKLDEVAETIDEQAAASKKPGNLAYAFARSLIINSIFGLLCALIVKRQRPEYMQ